MSAGESLSQILDKGVAFGAGGRRRSFKQYYPRELSARMDVFSICAVRTEAINPMRLLATEMKRVEGSVEFLIKC